MALQAAPYGGHDQIVHRLLENGADVNAQGGFFGKALQGGFSWRPVENGAGLERERGGGQAAARVGGRAGVQRQ
jgi:hypothetical protein